MVRLTRAERELVKLWWIPRRKRDDAWHKSWSDALQALHASGKPWLMVKMWPRAGIYVWLITGMPFSDPTSGYKCFRRRALQAVALDAIKSDGYSFQIEVTNRLWRHGFRIAEVPITFTERVEGSSKLTRHIILEAFWMVWWLWLQNGCRRWPRKH